MTRTTTDRLVGDVLDGRYEVLQRLARGGMATVYRAWDRRLERIGMPPQYGSLNPFPWMSETVDLAKEKNFFETRVTEYQSASALSWD